MAAIRTAERQPAALAQNLALLQSGEQAATALFHAGIENPRAQGIRVSGLAVPRYFAAFYDRYRSFAA